MEDLPVRAVVAEEGDLREHDREDRGDGELPPRVPDEDDRDPDARERGRGQIIRVQ